MEDIHILGVGEHVHEGLPKILDEFRSSKLILIVEENVYSTPGPPKKNQILQAMEKVREIANILNKDFEVKRIKKISLDNVRDAVFEIFKEHPNARFYFNITHGTKIISNGLFLMSIWLQGTAYYVDQSEGVQTLSIPRMHVGDLINNPNYIALLEILNYEEGNSLPYKDAFIKLTSRYTPMRGSGTKTKRCLQKGTFSKWIKDLSGSGLIEVRFIDGSIKQKEILLTNDGAFSLKFAKVVTKDNVGDPY